eukprot:CAMPEP_0197457842 /NCGR_PEP_ID=MMETSP1175-20131217/47213_1 /TAXON_ID=1003142 /ORGANISM="Triceratium dubium, Strain CCMP147" /LENGTH=245 /DNA_ID=CAMNT_0042992319 /DNA_START=65 /DNA_END=802 /DNA_ORIENTATION=+
MTEVAKAEDAASRREAMDRFVERMSAEGFNATLDQPPCFLYRELMEYYPEAKVLRTERDASAWARSMVHMVYSIDLLSYQPPYNFVWNRIDSPFGYWAKKRLGYSDDEIHPRGVPFNGTNSVETKSSISLHSCEAAYHRYQREVESAVQQERLVSYSVKQGWEPLCEHFLRPGTECPKDEPFPRMNSGSDGFLLDWTKKMEIRVGLHKLHPALAGQVWLVRAIAWVLKKRRILSNKIRRAFGSEL